jgi:hypothetical protein
MSKLHLDLKIVSSIPDAYKLPSDAVSRLSGANLGNLAFRHALHSLVADFKDYKQVDNND